MAFYFIIVPTVTRQATQDPKNFISVKETIVEYSILFNVRILAIMADSP